MADLLQNVPSLTVDLDGNVSLRGSSSVTLLIDGRESSILTTNRGAALEQMPSDSLARVEIITNPSAKYKPDGTGGIINLVTKRPVKNGTSGTWTMNAGPDDRYSTTLVVGAKTCRWDATGSASVRQDDRVRTTQRERVVRTAEGTRSYAQTQSGREHARPLSRIVRGSIDYRPDPATVLGVAGSFNRRTFLRTDLTTTETVADPSAGPTGRFDRRRRDDEYERDIDLSAHFSRDLAGADHRFATDVRFSDTAEEEDNHYVETYRVPVQADELTATLIRQFQQSLETNVEYNRVLPGEIKADSGYVWERHRSDLDFRGTYVGATSGHTVVDPVQTNRFKFEENVHAIYVTGERTWDGLAMLAGLRMEQASVDSHLVGTDTTIPNDNFNLYPSLHLARSLGGPHELQLNYSRRVRRPEGDDLNPFAEYQDPQNLRVGNPRLKPEDIDSLEFGHQYRTDTTTVVSTLYFRRHVNGITDTVEVLPGEVVRTTKQNLGRQDDRGAELSAEGALTPTLSYHADANLFRDELDATNLGFSASRTAVSYLLKLGVTYRPRPRTMIQMNGRYDSTRLTATGRRGAVYGVNLGVRQDLWQKRAAISLTISDLFNTRREVREIDTGTLSERTVRRRDARLVYLGFTYRFGAGAAKPKDDALRFDDAQ